MQEVQGALVLQCATFHIRREHADDLLSVFRRCSLFQRLTSFDVVNIEDHTDGQTHSVPLGDGSGPLPLLLEATLDVGPPRPSRVHDHIPACMRRSGMRAWTRPRIPCHACIHHPSL